MSLENVIIGTIAAIFGCIATIITAMIANRRKETSINESKLKSSIEAIVGELNIESAYFYILNDSGDKTTNRSKVELQTKYKYESRSAKPASGETYEIYQITGDSGRTGVFICNRSCEALSTRLSEVGRHF